MFCVQKSVNVFRINQIVFEINLTNDKRNKIVNVSSIQWLDDFCGKNKSNSIAHVPKQWRTLQRRKGAGENDDTVLWAFSKQYLSRSLRSVSCGGKMESTFRRRHSSSTCDGFLSSDACKRVVETINDVDIRELGNAAFPAQYKLLIERRNREKWTFHGGKVTGYWKFDRGG